LNVHRKYEMHSLAVPEIIVIEFRLRVVNTSGVATVGHGWARAHPTSARVGREICTNSKSFLGEVEVGGR